VIGYARDRRPWGLDPPSAELRSQPASLRPQDQVHGLAHTSSHVEATSTLSVIASSNEPLLFLAGDLTIIAASASFCRTLQIDPASVPGRQLSELAAGEWAMPKLISLLKATASGSAEIGAYEIDLVREGGEPRCLVLNARKLDDGDSTNVNASPEKGVRRMGHRLDIASGKNEFDRRLGNFRVQIKVDDEGEQVVAITASIRVPRHLSEHQRSSGIPSTVDISALAPDALRLAVSILKAARSAGLRLPGDFSVQ
jgi:hypothetical protein